MTTSDEAAWDPSSYPGRSTKETKEDDRTTPRKSNTRSPRISSSAATVTHNAHKSSSNRREVSFGELFEPELPKVARGALGTGRLGVGAAGAAGTTGAAAGTDGATIGAASTGVHTGTRAGSRAL